VERSKDPLILLLILVGSKRESEIHTGEILLQNTLELLSP
jgi:hypothetical protein